MGNLNLASMESGKIMNVFSMPTKFKNASIVRLHNRLYNTRLNHTESQFLILEGHDLKAQEVLHKYHIIVKDPYSFFVFMPFQVVPPSCIYNAIIFCS